MKNLVSTIIIAICLFVGTNNANACEWQLETPISTEDISIVTEKVQYVTFHDGWYYLVTQSDEDGGRWVLEIEEAEKMDKKRLAKLEKEHYGKLVDIQYTGDYEYISWYWFAME
ncbi:hypothetical protein [Paenibacillus agilis]|uniref:Uncharacterized protein n=1 Tax=Paenibacillus agilis TaxID=3020863 RepID=A0A559IEG4_9BACL|nr:hypothetical protein [Paenibacillus agilis]TVX86054.1 hypothetical protein FPZ44_24235 [Paenibacillus agilis]